MIRPQSHQGGPGPGSHPVILRANSPATPGTIQDTLPPALPVQRIPNPHGYAGAGSPGGPMPPPGSGGSMYPGGPPSSRPSGPPNASVPSSGPRPGPYGPQYSPGPGSNSWSSPQRPGTRPPYRPDQMRGPPQRPMAPGRREVYNFPIDSLEST